MHDLGADAKGRERIFQDVRTGRIVGDLRLRRIEERKIGQTIRMRRPYGRFVLSGNCRGGRVFIDFFFDFFVVLVFKKLIYEMRFDEASAKYAAFGPFYTGLQFSPVQLSRFLAGDETPALLAGDVRETVLR